MFPNTSTQSQNIFKDCLGFARHLSQSPGFYFRLLVKLGENSFHFQTGSPGKFPEKRESPSDYRRDQRRRKHHGKGMPTPGNHVAGSVAPRVPLGAQTGHTASSSPSFRKTVPFSRHLFPPTNIPQLDGAGHFISEKE